MRTSFPSLRSVESDHVKARGTLQGGRPLVEELEEHAEPASQGPGLCNGRVTYRPEPELWRLCENFRSWKVMVMPV